MARTVECSGIRSRRVLFSMEERLGRMMLCPMKGPGCKTFVDDGGYVLCDDWWVIALAVDIVL